MSRDDTTGEYSQRFSFEYRETDSVLHRPAADSEIEVLMSEDFSTPTMTLVRADGALGDTIFSIMEEVLTDREQYVLNAWVFERLGVRAIGQQLSLSKSQVWRIKESAVAKLKVILSGTPAVQSWLSALGSPSIETETHETGD